MGQSRTGRRPLYKTPEEMQAAVDRYFKACEGVPAYDREGNPIIRRGRQCYTGELPPTISGLSLFLGYKDRRTFTRQRERGQAFFDVVEGAKLRIENFWEQALYSDETYCGAVYMLRAAFGWGRQDFETQEEQGRARVRIIDRQPKGTGGTQAPGDMSIMSTTRGDLLN